MTKNFTPTVTAFLSPTASSQNIAFPSGCDTVVAYNSYTEIVFITFAASIAVPTNTLAPVYAVFPGEYMSYPCPKSGGVMSYIATGTTSTLTVMFGKSTNGTRIDG